MMSHDQVAELLPLYALDALERDEHLLVEAELGVCDSCREELRSYQTVASALVPQESSPDHVWDRIVAILDSRSLGTA